MQWLGSSVLAVLVIGCGCPSPRLSKTGVAPMASFEPVIAACVGGQDCRPLCAGVFGLGLGADIVHCRIRSLIRADLTTLAAPIDSATDLRAVTSANVAVMYMQHGVCTGAVDDRTGDDGWTDADWSDDDWSDDDGACDDGACDEPPGDDSSCDDGACDEGPGDDDPGDSPGDDGGDDSSGGDDGGGDSGGGAGGDGVTGGHGVVAGRIHRPAASTGSGTQVRPRTSSSAARD